MHQTGGSEVSVGIGIEIGAKSSLAPIDVEPEQLKALMSAYWAS